MPPKNLDHYLAKPSEARLRDCLTCKRQFLSQHFGNRLCDPCRVLNLNMVEPGNSGGRKERK